jgi:hypothetical protein
LNNNVIACFVHIFSPSIILFILCAFTAQFALHQTSGSPGDKYYGLHATMDVYDLELKPGQGSSTGIWVNHRGDGVKSSLNAIRAGWHVCTIFAFQFRHKFSTQILVRVLGFICCMHDNIIIMAHNGSIPN